MVDWDSEFKAADTKVSEDTKAVKTTLTMAFALTVLLTNARKGEDLTPEQKAEFIGTEMLGIISDMGYDLVKRERAIQE